MIDDALRKSKPSVLAAALKTSRPVVKTVLPTGPKPSEYATGFQPGQSGAFVPAPVEAPIAAPVPAPATEAIAQAPAPALQTPNQVGSYPGGSLPPAAAEPAAAAPAPAPAFVAPKNQEELDALIAGGISSSDEEKNQRAMEATIKAKFQAERDLNVEEQKIKVANAEKEAKAAENYASEFRATNQKQKEILDSSYGYFAPTQENAKDIAGIFSILMLATMGSGTQNKYSGMNALASLTGAMKGYKEGREDVYRKEMASYDKNVAEFTRRTENSLKELKIAQEELAVDKDAAMARMRAVAAADSGSMASLKLRSGRLEEAIQLLKHQADSIRTHNEKVAALEEKKRVENERIRMDNERNRRDEETRIERIRMNNEIIRRDQANEAERIRMNEERIREDKERDKRAEATQTRQESRDAELKSEFLRREANAERRTGATIAALGSKGELVTLKDGSLARVVGNKIVPIEGGTDATKFGAKGKGLASSDDVSSYLSEKGIHIANKKDRDAVQSSVNAMAMLGSLKDQVSTDPNLVGRQGQIRQFTDRYIESFKTNGSEPTGSAQDQAALRFAKKYASMLTRYEQALAGSNRSGSTVAFQKRYNDLLSQNQFNAAGMGSLLDDMSVEVARGAREKSPKITMAVMEDMASEFEGGIDDKPTSAGGSNIQLPLNPNRHFIGTEAIIPNKENTGWIYEKTGKAVK